MRAMLGEVELSIVSSERLRHSAETTDKPVERGQDISDHTKTNAPTIELVGAVVGEDASAKLNKLKKYQQEGTLVKYVFRNEYYNMFILDIGTRHEVQIRNGYEFNITLKQIKIAKAESIEIKVVSPKIKTSVKPKTNKGRQQPQQKKVSNIPMGYDTPGEALLNRDNQFGIKPLTESIVELYKLTPNPHGGGGRRF